MSQPLKQFPEEKYRLAGALDLGIELELMGCGRMAKIAEKHERTGFHDFFATIARRAFALHSSNSDEDSRKVRDAVLRSAPFVVLESFMRSTQIPETHQYATLARFHGDWTLPPELLDTNPERWASALKQLGGHAMEAHPEVGGLVNQVLPYYGRFGMGGADVAAGSIGFALDRLDVAWQAMYKSYNQPVDREVEAIMSVTDIDGWLEQL